MKRILIVAGVLAALVVALLVAGVWVLHSDWFFHKVRDRVISELEKATGGKVQLAGFRFDWTTLVAEVDGLVIRGTEPAGAAPLLSAKRVSVGLKILSMVRRDVDAQFIDVIQPQVNLLIAADGQTNIPEPKVKRTTGKPVDQIILDLALGRFSAQTGLLTLTAAARPPKVLPWSLNGRNLKTAFIYGASRYSGTVSIQPLEAQYGDYKLPIPSGVDAALIFERDHITVTSGKLSTAASHVTFSGDIRGLQAPLFSGKYQAEASAEEVGKVLGLPFRETGTLTADGGFQYRDSADFEFSGKLQGADVNYHDKDIRLDHLRVASSFRVGPKKIDLTDVHASGLGGTFQGLVTLADLERFTVKGRLAGFEFNRVADLAHAPHPPLNARFSGPVELHGTMHSAGAGLKYNHYQASAQLTVSPAAGTQVNGYLDAHYDGARNVVQFGSSYLALPASRADFKGSLNTQAATGRAPRLFDAELQLKLTSTDLNEALLFVPDLKEIPVSLDKGHAEFDGTLSGAIAAGAVTITGHLSANSVMVEKQKIDAFSADITASRDGLQVRSGVLAYENMRARLAGTLALQEWKAYVGSAVTATASLQNADIANILALAGQPRIPVKGSVAAEAQVNGTLADPRATATVRVGKGVAYGEPFDRATANVTYVNGGRQDFTAEADAGPRKLTLTGNYRPTATDFLAGVVQAHATTTEMALNQIATLREAQPTLGGTAQATADAEIRLLHPKTGEQYEIVKLNGDLKTRNLALEKKPLGDVHLVAVTNGAGPMLHLQLDSNLAHSTIHGVGDFKLGGEMPGSGEATFSGVKLSEVRKIFVPGSVSLESVGGSVEGKITFKGDALQPRKMAGTLEIPKLEIKPEPGGATPIPESLRDVVIRNAGTIRASMTNGNIRVETARVTAHTKQDSTDLNLAGTINLNAGVAAPLNLRASGKLDLSILPMFERDLVSSGTVAATATIRGAFTSPDIAGRLDVTNANLNLEGLPNGLSNANGTILFDGARATIQALSADTGGGKVNMSGFASFGNGPMAFRLEADAKDVRVRYPEGVSTSANANLRLIGTTERSTLSGTITVLRSAFTPRTDLGSLLESAAAPVQTPAVQMGLVGNMQFDIDVRTAPDISFQTKLAQGLQADANLRLRGTLSNPVLLGRININQGDLTFFGNKYTINEGSISFFNPVKLEPVLDISLETRARGVDVTINITGPATKLEFNYRSDPPLQFSDLVALLATGRTPNNPTLAARDTGSPQTWQSMGASALLGEAIANPLSNRLQRFFGVSKIKIDPLLTGVSGNAQARLTIEQNITPDLTFTYITNVASSTGSAQVIRVEWDFSRHWSAVAIRDEYGYFGIDFQYRKRLK